MNCNRLWAGCGALSLAGEPRPGSRRSVRDCLTASPARQASASFNRRRRRKVEVVEAHPRTLIVEDGAYLLVERIGMRLDVLHGIHVVAVMNATTILV